MSELTKNRLRQLYQFLREATQLRYRPVRLLSDQRRVLRLSALPVHESLQVYPPVYAGTEVSLPEVLVRVSRPLLTPCPPPPDAIANWLKSGWDNPATEPQVAESKNILDAEGGTVTVRFDEHQARTEALREWRAKREEWATPEIRARTALATFEAFYDIYSALEKEGEDLELVIADGHLVWLAHSSIDGSVKVDHPVLLKRVELRFDPNKPEFTVHEVDRAPELYGAMLVDLEGLNPTAIRERKDELDRAGYHPLGLQDTDGYLRALIQTVSPIEGQYLAKAPHDGANSTPRLYRDPVLLLRKRVAGLANAIDQIITSIEQQDVFPSALAQITGTAETWSGEGLGASGDTPRPVPRPQLSDDDILLAKEANAEQMQIIRRLTHNGAVIVQGPPGTGKTHTIGNVIGHLLAQGKSILVTAQTAKALRVLRDKVPTVLQPLAVSVLGSDQDARRQLESSIASITERLTGASHTELLQRADRLEVERRTALAREKELAAQLKEAKANEYRDIEVAGKPYTPSDGARFVAENRETLAWIPAPVRVGAPLGLDAVKVGRLYSLGMTFSADEERDARHPLPDLRSLPNQNQFRLMVSEYQHLITTDLSLGELCWKVENRSSETLAPLVAQLAGEFSDEQRRHAWRPHAIVAGMHGAPDLKLWEHLIEEVESACQAYAEHSLQLHHKATLAGNVPVGRQSELCAEIIQHLADGKALGFIQLLTRGEWKALIQSATVAAGKPVHAEHFKAIGALAVLEHRRNSLRALWDSLVGVHINQPFDSLGPAPETSCRALLPEIRRCLRWHQDVWDPLMSLMAKEGLDVGEILAAQPREPSPVAEYLVIERIATTVLPDLLTAEIGRRKLREAEEGFAQLANLAAQASPEEPDMGCIGRLLAAVRTRNVEAYGAALAYAGRLASLQPLIKERDALLTALAEVAPAWANLIATRIPPHDQGVPPGDVASAWTWRQLHDALAERDQVDAVELQKQLDRCREQIRRLTEELIDARAWGRQLEHLHANQGMRQALVGWLDTTKRLISVRNQERRQLLGNEARKLMRKCAGAVPVWIMPINLVAENFDATTTSFDVVIIDEASQADLNALIPLYLGKQVIVVGDHEQVTPLGVGKDQTILENLRRSMLADIPNSHLFDNQGSIYDISRQSFGDAIRLVEHFRCVPEIISFSNKLSYEGRIKPLREASSTTIKPACVARRVDGVRSGKINEGEARFIVDTIKAMIEHDEYRDKSIGVISMLGEEQAVLIESMIHKEVSGSEVARRRILAGISSEFQGDERDIMFLSMVDSPEMDGMLRTVSDGAFEQTKKRYNVAASRARDQMWVVHSFDPDRHLRSADLRMQLLQHVRDPMATIRAFEAEEGKTESPFERAVLKRLTDAGFKVRTQWPVGYFRIDMVVEGGGRRLAIECDGDRYHPIEKLADDMERQAILERLGWRFVRIRGSAFYRDPDRAMRPVFDRLAEMEIPAEGQSDPAGAADMTIVYQLDEIRARYEQVFTGAPN